MNQYAQKIIEKLGLIICPDCGGEGEYEYFCGHETTTTCSKCEGKGIVKSLNIQKRRKKCVICDGRGGEGCCEKKGYIEWEIYEPAEIK